jgi:D-alanyl-D-alanine carboxypeptidase (penicillin-binding protein 5/6)
MARHRRGSHGPRPRRVIVAGLATGIVLGGALIAAAAVPLPSGPPTLSVAIAAAPAPSHTPTLDFPQQGEAAVAVPSLGVFEAPGDQSPVPIASLTKLMAAEVALRALPLGPTDDGPTIVVTPADVKEYKADLRDDQSSVA